MAPKDLYWPVVHQKEQAARVAAINHGTIDEALAEMLDDTENMLQRSILECCARIQISK